jgi:hypothetical protein
MRIVQPDDMLKLLMSFCNSFGILSVIFDQESGKIETSKRILLKNLLLLPPLFLLVSLISNTSVFQEGLRPEALEMITSVEFTIFFSYVFGLFFLVNQLITMLVLCTNSVNYKKVSSFTRCFVRFFESCASKNSGASLRNRIFRKLSIYLALSLNHLTMANVIFYKLSWQGLVCWIQNYVLTIPTMSFTIFLSVLIMFFEHNLKVLNKMLRSRNDWCDSSQSIQRINFKKRFLDICKILEMFNETFNFLMSTLIAFNLLSIIIWVVALIKFLISIHSQNFFWQIYVLVITFRIEMTLNFPLRIQGFFQVITLLYSLEMFVSPSESVKVEVIILKQFI